MWKRRLERKAILNRVYAFSLEDPLKIAKPENLLAWNLLIRGWSPLRGVSLEYLILDPFLLLFLLLVISMLPFTSPITAKWIQFIMSTRVISTMHFVIIIVLNLLSPLFLTIYQYCLRTPLFYLIVLTDFH